MQVDSYDIMSNLFRPLQIFVCLIGLLASRMSVHADTPKPAPIAKMDYARDVRPILAANCFACHGQDDKARAAGLRLDLREGAMGKLGSGRAVIVPGKPDASPLLQRIKAGGALHMPPVQTGKTLKPQEIATLRKWIAEGAQYKAHWAFTKPQLPSLPKVKNAAWAKNPIDVFILSRLEQEGLKPSPEADRYALIRRVSLDLIGLPPTPEEVQAFIADKSPNAYARVVDRLLDSPHYGEKWARMWLDLARYADSAGYGSDPLRPNLYPFRDWVIAAFNRNLPYDQFTLEQIAGDLLPNPTRDQLIATGFHRNTMTNTEGGTDDEEFRMAAVKDRAITTSQVWMGLTIGCAQCHNHKFDPLTQKDFYRFAAFFNQTEDNDQPDERPTMPLLTHEQTQRSDTLKREMADLQAKLPMMPELKAEIEKKKKELDAIKPLAYPVMREVAADKRRESFVLTLGNFLQRGEKVEPETPASFPPTPPNTPRNRLGVAQWLVSPDNPMTARVAVNRFWAQIFGIGLVETEEDFGLQGSLPIHPELLDYLAVRFQSSVSATPTGLNWEMKKLLRLIVTSATYRQSSQTTPALIQKDPRNRLLARFPRRRLEAEMVRDQALALSGSLSPKIGGASVYPPQPAGLWQAAFNGERTWQTSTGEDRYRRGLYTFWRRTVPYPSMATFDAPSREICTMRRLPTNTPLQALVTLNDPVYLELAQALGRRIVKEGGITTESRIQYALNLVTGRPARAEQAVTLQQLYTEELAHYRTAPDDAKKLATEPLGVLPEGMDAAEQAVWTVVANVLLNLDSVLTKG